MAYAGHYQLMAGYPTGGTLSVTSASSQNYASGSGGYGASLSGGGTPATGTASGQITTKYQWITDYPGEPPPLSVIVTQSCDVHAGGYGQPYSATGTLNNGLGQTVSVSNPSSTFSTDATSTKNEVKTGTSVLEVDCTPSASVSENGALVLSVTYSVSVSAVKINVVGTTPDSVSGVPSILIGQGATANLLGGSFVGYNWSVSGTLTGGFSVVKDGGLIVRAMAFPALLA